MRKLTITCDCCSKEIPENLVFPVEHFVHVSPSFNKMQGHSEIIDGKPYSISGRSEKKDFFLPCYNMLFSRFFEAIKGYPG